MATATFQSDPDVQDISDKLDSFKRELGDKIDWMTATISRDLAILRWMLGINLIINIGIFILL